MIGPALLSVLVAGAAGGVRFETNFAEAMKKASASNKPVMVDFWAEWCGWCHRLEKTTYLDPTVTKLSQDFVAVKVDTEGKPSEVEVALRFDVTSLPTILFITPDGRQILRVNGFQGPGKFPRTLERAKDMAGKLMAYEAALGRDNKDSVALAALGTHLFEQESFDEAKELLLKAARYDARDLPATRRQTRMLLAIIHHYDHRYDEAETLLKEALGIAPLGEDEAKLLFILGRTYMKWGRGPDARRYFTKIVSEHPESPMARKAQEQLDLLGAK